MSRLRNVQGVTRVSLSKSEKADAGAGGGAAGTTVGPCGKGTPPSFEVVVFFEKAAVADALATVTGDTGTAGSTGTAASSADSTGKSSGDSSATPASTPAATPGG